MDNDPNSKLILYWATVAAEILKQPSLGPETILPAFRLLAEKRDSVLPKEMQDIRWPPSTDSLVLEMAALWPKARPIKDIAPALLEEFYRENSGFSGPWTAWDLLDLCALNPREPVVDELLSMTPGLLELIQRRRPRRRQVSPLRSENGVWGSPRTGPAEVMPRESASRPRSASPSARAQFLQASMRDARNQRSRLVELLEGAVVGQHGAVEMLADAYGRMPLLRGGSGPKGVFTFIGPPGVGKTLLVESFASALSKIESAEIAFKRFDMSTYAGGQNFEQLFGAEQFYKGNRAGTLTGFVKDNPEAVILFDEIEKAHPSVIQALLPILDKGQVADKNLEQVVSFDGCWLFFTTNLGRELWASADGIGVLDDVLDAKDLAWDLLAHSRRSEAGEDDAPALSAEFVSRLAKGEAVFLRRLNTKDLQTVLDRAVRQEISRVLQTDEPMVELHPAASRLFLLSQLPRLDARRAVSRGKEWALTILELGGEAATAQDDAGLPEVVRIGCDDEAWRYLEGKLKDQRPTLLLVDDDDYLESDLAAMCASMGAAFRRTSTKTDAEACLSKGLPDLVLLDLSIGEDAQSSKVEFALSFLAFLRERIPEVRVYLYSENPHLRHAFPLVVKSVMKNSKGREFFACEYKEGKPESLGAFVGWVHDLLDAWRFDQLLKNQERANVSLKVDLNSSLDSDGSLQVDVVSPKETRSVSLPDVLTGNFYQGIPRERFDDVIGVSRAKERLRSVLDWLKDPGLLGRFGLRPPRGYLLSGPPGTGKTLLAKALAGETRLPFLAVSASQLWNRWVGETERLIRQLFEQANHYAPAIVFIDEIDGLATRRDDDSVGWRRSALSQLLVCMDGLQSPSRPVFVLGATNDADHLDRALLRPGRFDEVIQVDLPNQEARKAFFESRLKDLPWEGHRDLAQLALSAWLCSPAEMDRMVRETGYLLAKEGRTAFTQTDLLRMIHLVQYGASSPDKTCSEEQKKITAWHEAGHAVVTKVLLPFRRLDYLTIIPNDGGYLGLTGSVMEEENKLGTAKEILSYMAVSMGGRAAEMKLTGGLEGVSSGCSDDLTKAARRAYEAITSLGLDPEFGPVGLSGLPSSAQGSFQTKAADRVRFWLEAAEKAAKQVLDEHADKLEALAEALLKAETMDAEAIEKVLGR